MQSQPLPLPLPLPALPLPLSLPRSPSPALPPGRCRPPGHRSPASGLTRVSRTHRRWQRPNCPAIPPRDHHLKAFKKRQPSVAGANHAPLCRALCQFEKGKNGQGRPLSVQKHCSKHQCLVDRGTGPRSPLSGSHVAQQLVFKRFIELAEAKVTEAQAQAEQQLLDAIDDLEASETPESVMLSTVSSEQSKDRTDRAVVTPWLKFLWESYRTVLEILRNNARLEQMYQTTAHQAFNFCRVYTRKTEFRRLCDLLRNHLQNVAKYSNQPHSINLNDPDTLQRHLDTRFNQLNVASDLELWQEAFRAVEDIHSLLSMSKRPPKNVYLRFANLADALGNDDKVC